MRLVDHAVLDGETLLLLQVLPGGWCWHRNHAILKGRMAMTGSPVSPPPRMISGTNGDPTFTLDKELLPQL